MYDLNELDNPGNRKKLSFSELLSTGRQKQIKQKILICLEKTPMTAWQLSEQIPCLRSSVCFALKKLCISNLVSDKDSTFDMLTERNVTLYSLK